MKKGELAVNQVITGVIAIAVLLLVLGTGFFSDIINEIRNTPDFNNTKELRDGLAIVAYNLDDGKVYSYEEGDFYLIREGEFVSYGSSVFSEELLRTTFYDFYYGLGNYFEKRESVTIDLIDINGDPNIFRNINLGQVVDTNEDYPSFLDNRNALVKGNLDRLEKISGNDIYISRMFLISQEGEFYLSSGQEYVDSGNLPPIGEFKDGFPGLRDGPYKVTFYAERDNLFDLNLYNDLSKIDGLLWNGDYFYEDNNGNLGERTSFYVKEQFNGNYRIYIENKPIDAYIEASGNAYRMYAKGAIPGSYIKRGESENEKALLNVSVGWRDSIFSNPIELENENYCSRKNGKYILIDFGEGTTKDEDC